MESVIPKHEEVGLLVNQNDDEIADNNHDNVMTCHDAAKWILFAIGKEYEEAFTFVAKKLGMPVNGDKFSAEPILELLVNECYADGCCQRIYTSFQPNASFVGWDMTFYNQSQIK